MSPRDGRISRYALTAWILGAALATLLLGAAGWFTFWKNSRMAALEARSGLALLQQGVMEFADRGDGPPVLVIHGSPGGYDQGLVYGEELRRRGFRVIAISRPGYLRTPLRTGVTMEEQADAMDDLLSSLGIRRCAVIAVSEGSPSAIELARRHPDRVASLALISPLADSLGRKPIASLGYGILHDLTGDLGCWWLSLLLRADPEAAFERILALGSSLPPSGCRSLAQKAMADPLQRAFLSGLALSITPLSPREPGIINDNTQLKHVSPLPPGSLTTPVLILMGERETHSSREEMKAFLSRLPRAESSVISANGHILPIGPEFGEDWDRIAGFLKTEGSSSSSTP